MPGSWAVRQKLPVRLEQTTKTEHQPGVHSSHTQQNTPPSNTHRTQHPTHTSEYCRAGWWVHQCLLLSSALRPLDERSRAPGAGKERILLAAQTADRFFFWIFERCFFSFFSFLRKKFFFSTSTAVGDDSPVFIILFVCCAPHPVQHSL